MNTSPPKFHGIIDAMKPMDHEHMNETDMIFGPGYSLETRPVYEQELRFRFYNNFHPFVDKLINQLIKKSVSGLLAADTEFREDDDGSLISFPEGKPKSEDYALYETFFDKQYDPNDDLVDKDKHPVKNLDFAHFGAYSVYNWELFLHVPLTIGIHLSKNQRFAEAQQWFHHVFNPTDDSEGPTPARFWKVQPFQCTDVELIEDTLVNLSTGVDEELRNKTVQCIEEWKNQPFRPHVIARYRPTAYMFKTVTAYLDNLIAWGDTLFRQDTGESINEATQLYILAAGILGPRPQAVPKKGDTGPKTYAELRDDLDAFSNALVELESSLPFDILPYPSEGALPDQFNTLRSIGMVLYFCVPRNDKLLGYWDTVADRLFKIRNSLNIQGIFRQLPLFEPPIDPGLLAKAAAAGLDVGAVVSGLNQPLPLVRFRFLVQKAAEICQEVKSLGNSLLSAIEKEDNEVLAVLRVQHEGIILGLAETIKYAQWQEAIKARESLVKSFDNAKFRYTYYERLLGRKEDTIDIPELEDLNDEGLEKMDFSQDEPDVRRRPIGVDIAKEEPSLPSLRQGTKLNRHELNELEKLKIAISKQASAATVELIASGLSLIPQFDANLQPMGLGVSTGFGGVQLSKVMSMVASAKRISANLRTYEANNAAKIGSYKRREQEWAFQSNLAAGEITQTFKQLRAAQIREAIAERDWHNHQEQMRTAEEIQQFLQGEETSIGDQKHKKTSTQSFYAWMKREVKGLYGQCYQFAYDVAKKAERALQHELGDPQLSLLKFGYLDGKEGLLAGEKLYMGIKRMEVAYHDLNQREYELTKHVSLLQVNPIALLQLRATGRCNFTLPEELFDMDGPGHFFRRIKSVGVSLPCVAGPYTSVNCTLTLLKSRIRQSSQPGSDGYAYIPDDSRFSEHFGSMQTIVTSMGQNDSGLFETNLHDERYLPFEGSGVISEWQLKLPADPSNYEPCQFDYDTISDVILHIRYTAREGGEPLRSDAITNLNACIDEAQAAGSVRLFSVRHEFPSAWAAFKSIAVEGDTGVAKLTINLEEEHYPFWSQNRIDQATVKQAEIFAKTIERVTVYERVIEEGVPDPAGSKDTIEGELGDLKTGTLTILPDAPIGEYTLYFDDNSMEGLWLALTWGKAD